MTDVARSVRQALDGGGAVLLVGAAGIGKTTLVRRVVRGREHRIGQSLDALSGMTYRPLVHAMARPLSGSPEDVATELAATLQGTTLVIEDLHWSDSRTLDVVPHLVGRVPLLLTARPSPAADQIAAVAESVTIEPLRPRAADGLARRLHPGLDAASRRQLVATAGGNPLLIHELVTATELHPTLFEAISERIRRLPEEAIDAIGRLALTGYPTTPTELHVDVELIDGFVDVDRDGRVWFRHERIAREVLRVLEPAACDRIREDLARRGPWRDRARHLHSLGRTDEAAQAAIRAAADATTADRADLLALAVTCLGPAAANELRLQAAAALVSAHRPDDVRTVLVGLTGPAADLAEAELHRGQAAWLDGDAATALAALDRGIELAADLPQPVLAHLTVERASILVRTLVGDPRLPTIASEAQSVACSVRELDAQVENVLGLARLHSGQPGWDVHFRAATELARRSGDVEEELAAAYWLVSALGFYGPFGEAVALGGEMLRRTESLRLIRWRHHFLGAHLIHRITTGRYDDDLVAAGHALLRAEPGFRNRAQVDLALTFAAIDRRDVPSAQRIIGAGLRHARSAEDEAVLRCAAITLAKAEGDADAACSTLRLLADSGAGFFGFNAAAAAFTAQACIGAGVRRDLPSFDTTLSPILDVATIELQAYGQWCAGDLHDAVDRYEIAATAWKERGLWRFAGWATLAAIDVAIEGGMFGRAQQLVGALVDADPVAGTWLPNAVAVRRQRLDRRRAGATLTSREHEILRLVGTGMSTAAIAGALGISRATVDTHVHRAMRKLGCTTRQQAAARTAAV